MSKENTEFLRFQIRFLFPQYWGVWLGFALLRLLSMLPYKHALAVGRQLGKLAHFIIKTFIPSRIQVLKTNLRLCFPELTESQRQSIEKKFWPSLGMSVIESGIAWWGSTKKINKLFQVNGYKHLQQAQQDKRGVVIISSHQVTLELSSRHLCNLFPTYGTGKPTHNPVAHYIINKARCRYGENMFFEDDYRNTTKALKSGKMVAFMLDVNFSSQKRAVFAPFMGVNASTTTAFTRMAKSNHYIYIALYCFRLPDAKGYSLEFLPLDPTFPSKDPKQDATYFNQVIANAIERYPEQYFWLHKRFKTQPDGAPSPYICVPGTEVC